MENKKEMSRVEQAIKTMRDEIKTAILNEEIEMEFSPSDTEGYYAELSVHVDELKFGFAIAETYICYFNDFTKGMFPEGSEDFEKLTKLTKKHVMQDLVNKYAHCATYKYGSEDYKKLDNLSETEYSVLQEGLAELGYAISYNNLDDCYCVH